MSGRSAFAWQERGTAQAFASRLRYIGQGHAFLGKGVLRFLSRLFWSASVSRSPLDMIRRLSTLAVIALVAGCAGGHGTTLPTTHGSGSGSGAGSGDGAAASAVFSFSFPKPTTAAAKRAPRYLSSATKSITIQATDVKIHGTGTDIYSTEPSYLIALNTTNFANLTGNPNTPGQCGTDPVNAGNYKCTVDEQMPIGDTTIRIISYDANGGTGNVLSEQSAVEWVQEGVANGFAIALDANVSAFTVTGSGACQVGTVGTAFGDTGTTPVTFTIGSTDADGKTIVAPGLPTIEIEDNTSTYQSTSGTITGTGGNVTFTINQSAGSFTLTPTSSSETGGTVNLKLVPPGSDGLSFAVTKSFTFSTGVAPPTHDFLAAVEQTSATSGTINFYTVTLGGSGGPDSLTAFSTPTLAVTNSTNENKADVDNPTGLAWDTNGDLLIANADNSSKNAGNLACVPAGAITTGANTSTTTSVDVTAPQNVAYDSGDGSVALSDLSPSSTYLLSEYLLSGDYALAPAARNISPINGSIGDNWATDIPLSALAHGTYAAALTDGAETDASASGNPAGTSKIVILSPNGTQTSISQTTTPTAWAVDVPYALAWDATNSQLVIANHSAYHPSVAFYTIGGSGDSPSASQTHVIGADTFADQATFVATAPNGYVAVAYGSAWSGNSLVQVYDNTTARNAVLGPIPFNGVTDAASNCDTYEDGGANATVLVEQLTWLSNTKLLLEVYDSVNSYTGLYIYDITASAVPGDDDRYCYDATSTPFAAAPEQTSFTHLTSTPHGVAFKP